MEEEAKPTQDKPPSQPEDAPPPFNPDPDLVTFLERGGKQDPKKVWKKMDPSE